MCEALRWLTSHALSHAGSRVALHGAQGCREERNEGPHASVSDRDLKEAWRAVRGMRSQTFEEDRWTMERTTARASG